MWKKKGTIIICVLLCIIVVQSFQINSLSKKYDNLEGRYSALEKAVKFLREARLGTLLFTFVQWSDIHTGSPLNDLPEAPLTQSIVQDIVTQRNFPLPDFIFLTGDLVEYGLDANCHFDRKDVEAEFKKSKEILSQLPIPWYPVVGNHDNWEGDYGPWDKYFPGRRRYSLRYQGYLFVVFDDFRTDSDSAEDAERRDWLQDILDAHPDHHIILVMHIPLIEMKPNLAPSEWFYVHSTAKPSLKEIVDGYDNIVAVLSGHLHLNNVIKDRGVLHITTAAVCSYPYMYRHFKIYPDRIEVCSYKVSNPPVCSERPWAKFGYAEDEDYTSPALENFTIQVQQTPGPIILASGAGLN